MFAEFIRHGCIDLFTTSRTSVPACEWQPPFWQCELKDVDRSNLERQISDREIFDAPFSLKPYKAPSPDGLHAGFSQQFWLVVGDSVKKEVKAIFCSGKVLLYLNQTLITLIPKCKSLESLNSYRPIGLCNSIYEVVTKIIVAHMRPLLADLVSPLQTALIPGRKGAYNAIIVQKLIHSMSSKNG